MNRYITVFLFLIFISLNFSLAAAAENDTNSDTTDCYSAIKENFQIDDSVKIENVDGYSYSGFLDKINKESITIRYVSGKLKPYVSTIYRQSFTVNNISRIDLKGEREIYRLMKKDYLLMLSVAAGSLIGYNISAPNGNSANSADNFKSSQFLMAVGVSIIFGEVLYRITSKKIPLELSIQCK